MEISKIDSLQTHNLENFKELKIYKSNSNISSLSYCGKIKDIGIDESNTISEEFTKKLYEFKGQASIGRTKVNGIYQKKNLHLYTNKASTLDGLYRIAYVKGVGNKLYVSECGRSWDKYSGYFKILEEQLVACNIESKNNFYIIDKSNINTFINILNKIIDIEETTNLYLSSISKNIKIKNEIFDTVYWTKNNFSINNISESECIDKLIEIIKNTKDKDSLNNIKTKLLDLSNLVESLQKLT